jgi:HEAT repeat protein
MGLFDLFSKAKGRSDTEHGSGKAGKSKGEAPAKAKKKPDRELARLARLVADKMSQNFDRQEALEQLAGIGTAVSAAALLRRFSWSMDPSITDQEEKEVAMRGIVAAGMVALDPIRAYCTKAESLTWPLRVLRQIVPADQVVEELLSILDEFDTEYVRNVEPKLQLLAVLEEYPSSEVRQAIEPFLADISEPVRFAAVTTTFAMNEPAAVPALLATLVDEESLRVRNRIAQGLAERGWEIPEADRTRSGEALPPDFELRGSRVHRVG